MTAGTTMSRRAKVRAAQLNGVDAVEVGDDGLLLTVTFLGKAPHGLGPENVRIDGGRRVTGITAVDVSVEREEDPELDDRLYVTLDRAGDTSRYVFALVETDPYGRPGTEPFRGFDQRYHRASFSFRPDCPTPFDCKEEEQHEPDFPDAPVVDYTARDYDTIRKLLLDRLALTTPDWVERNPADLGVTLVELLAYTGDQISYQQDAVATEAYLDTARRRVSVRRHVRLIDYAMHDGCTARAYVTVRTAGDTTLAPGTFRFASVDVRALDPHDRPEPGTVIDENDLGDLDERGSVEVFEPVVAADPLELKAAHNAIRLWTWGGEVCTLPKGATSATLRDEWDDPETCRERRLDLEPGDLLVLEEVKGPRTGTPGDQDPSHRQAVRLTSVTPAVDRIEDQPVLEVTWAAEDALRFPLGLTARGGRDCLPVEDVTVARGNVVLVDHGRTLTGLPETATVPPEPAVVAPCDPPAFGCYDRREGNAPARLINSLTDKAESAEALVPDDVRELFEVVGEAATVRAGLGLERAGQRHERVVPGTAYAQAAALRTLLAQSVHPGITPRFRPVLGRSPVVQAVSFPDAQAVAAGQAERIAAIPGRVRQRLVELWRSARDRDGLADEEIGELTVIYGLKVVERLELRTHPVRALRELLYKNDELLDGKLRRVDILVSRARAGAVLDGHIAWEIAHSWGPVYATGLHPEEQVLRGSATAALGQDPRCALPAVRVEDADLTWLPRRDLLHSGPRDRHFVGELEDDGRLALRFGDGRHGARPAPGSRLALHYRLGGGIAGNVGAEAINHLVIQSDCERPPAAVVRNPLPATGGVEPEPVEQARQLAPLDLRRTRLRAITAEDYAALAAQLPGVQRAAAEIRWTGSVQEAHVAIDAYGSAQPSAELLARVEQALEAYRRIGHDLVVGPARATPLDIALSVCAAPGHQHGQILAELYRVLGNGRLGDGRLGFFHPDALTFGEPVRLSRLVAVAAAVPGVRSVEVTRLRRLFEQDRGEREDGVLRLGPLEIATCDNDPDRPENGLLAISLGGAR
ncbi:MULTISPECIES: putative baseplate assembly protein [unclassified Streptomyces]|uniref:putative baseplate assembly protein n=1 Tax=unclassified Streptomyces TaxID=2593676 RepID=UPI00225AF648|nr:MULTISPECIES: putative baseplate assembly protein [unclassified Streptomyces]MCX5058297.1 putative baseplate assembly protein [Streptomyces sp. NBC_00452]MCX5289445.1 putative baseplate assembly protein [Streptomyces sp. NBC_00183]